MRNPTLVIFALLLTLVLTGAKHTERNGGVAAGDIWCVAKNNADDAALQSAIDWACGPGGADCRPIQQGGSCYDPGDIQSHASYAFNDYFIKNGGAEAACDFSGTAALTSLNPGHFISYRSWQLSVSLKLIFKKWQRIERGLWIYGRLGSFC
ncbi:PLASMODESMATA CALLOSE-BINDING PROTEIN 5-like isoform X2 [Carex rostrata]